MGREQYDGRELWERPSSSAAANLPQTGTWGGGGCSQLSPARLQADQRGLHHDKREAEGSKAQIPSCKLVLHVKAFLPEISEQFMQPVNIVLSLPYLISAPTRRHFPLLWLSPCQHAISPCPAMKLSPVSHRELLGSHQHARQDTQLQLLVSISLLLSHPSLETLRGLSFHRAGAENATKVRPYGSWSESLNSGVSFPAAPTGLSIYQLISQLLHGYFCLSRDLSAAADLQHLVFG